MNHPHNLRHDWRVSTVRLHAPAQDRFKEKMDWADCCTFIMLTGIITYAVCFISGL